MAFRKKRKSRTHAPATVYFGQARNEKGQKQLCVWAQCGYSGKGVGPIWSHTQQAVTRVLATLTSQCDCGRPFHKLRYSEGHRVFQASSSARQP
jgi:hypothetical protein